MQIGKLFKIILKSIDHGINNIQNFSDDVAIAAEAAEHT